jgi:hypothetical protein
MIALQLKLPIVVSDDGVGEPPKCIQMGQGDSSLSLRCCGLFQVNLASSISPSRLITTFAILVIFCPLPFGFSLNSPPLMFGMMM